VVSTLEEQKPHTEQQTAPGLLRSRWVGIGLVLLIGALLALVYSPLLLWLGKTTLRTEQLSTGGLLVLFAIVICMRDALEKLRVEPNLNNHGLGLLLAAFSCLWLVGRWQHWTLPLVLLSFCLSLAAIISFLFGKLGVRQFMPALGGFLVFGLLAGMFPTLDWPLREIAAKYSAGILSSMNVPVKLAAMGTEPPKLILAVAGKVYVVATECNGFGLLTSSLLLATILGFQNHLSWMRRISLLALAVPVAIVCNFLRIVNICLVVPRVNLPYNVIHEGIGTLFYLIGLAIVWCAAEEFVDKKPVENGESRVESPKAG
jgi:exosortase